MLNFLQNKSFDDLKNDLKAWPFEEAKKIINKLAKNKQGEIQIPQKGYVLFDTGYGPSGLPHIGTFSEVFRMGCIRKAFVILTNNTIPTKLLAVSDDMDAIRKVPDNIPEASKPIIKNYLGIALNSVPDPFGEFQSFSDYGNNKLKGFLKGIGFKVENFLENGKESSSKEHFNLDVCCFLSATEGYRSGLFNSGLIAAAKKYQELLDIMLPTLGEERQANYSPFMPLHSDNEVKNFVIAKDLISIDAEKCTMKYAYKGKEYEANFLNGGCKLQWKCDFGMRWAVLGVEYEFYGKDHWPNDGIYRAISRVLSDGHEPATSFYELFLDEEGKKISKSKGNGTDVDAWFKYSSEEVLSYYMYLKPQTAKRLYFDIIPKVTDEFLQMLAKYQDQTYLEKLNSPIFFVYNFLNSTNNDCVPYFVNEINYSLLLTLAFVCRAENEDILLNIIAKYLEKKQNKELINQQKASFSLTKSKIFASLLKSAINYYHAFFKASGIIYSPSEEETKMLKVFAKNIIADEEKSSESIQNIAYQVGKDFNVDLKDWFSLLYKVLLGLESGPRIGSLIAIYGFDKILKILEDKNLV